MPGAHVLPIYDCLHDSTVKSVLVKHEQGAAFMAGGLARVSHRPSACIATAGPGARDVVAAFSERFNIPVTTSLKAKGVVAEGTPLSLGCLGVTSNGEAYRYLADHADLLLFLGAGFNERTSYLWDAKLLANKTIAQVDRDAAQIARFESALWDGGFNASLLASCQSAWRRLETLIAATSSSSSSRWPTARRNCAAASPACWNSAARSATAGCRTDASARCRSSSPTTARTPGSSPRTGPSPASSTPRPWPSTTSASPSSLR
ncbi:MAG: thiamine pyrophosphate-binding protein [Thiobacillus sp.]